MQCFIVLRCVLMLFFYQELPLFCLCWLLGAGGWFRWANATGTEGCSCLVWDWKGWITFWGEVQIFPRIGPIPAREGTRCMKNPKDEQEENQIWFVGAFSSHRLQAKKKKQDCDGNITRWVTHISPSTPWKEQAKRKEGFDLEVIQMHRGDR